MTSTVASRWNRSAHACISADAAREETEMDGQKQPAADAGRVLGDGDFWRGLARAVAGALLFGLPVFMTMEMWRLGFTIPPLRLALFLALSVPLLVCLSYLAGFRRDAGWLDAIVDGLVAWLVGAVTAAGAL